MSKLIKNSDISVQPKWWYECEICKKEFTPSMIYSGPFCKFCQNYKSSDIPDNTKVCEKCTEKIRVEHEVFNHSAIDVI